jgi:Tol biopolymer transport system component
MTVRVSIAAFAALMLLVTAAPPALSYPRPGMTERVSVPSQGEQGNADANRPSISGDGTVVAFQSGASNLVPGDANLRSDIFVVDRTTGTIVRASEATDGAEGNAGSLSPSISGDGRDVAFYSAASTLVPGDTNGSWDVFVHDRVAGRTERVSIGPGGVEGDSHSGDPSISADGRFVAFSSEATNLIAGDGNGTPDVFVHDRETGVTERVSVAADGSEGSGHSYDPSITADGRSVALWSSSSNLVAGDANERADVFVRDREAGTTERVSVAADAAEAAGHSYATAISGDGRHVAFESWASNLVPADTNEAPDVFVRDREAGTTERVSVGADGAEGNNYSFFPSISGDGRHVAFYSLASNLVPGDTGAPDVFVRDRDTGTTEQVSVGPDAAQPDGGSASPSLSAAGRHVAFDSEASNLTSGDTNGTWDVFTRDRGPATGIGALEVQKVPGQVAVSGWATFSGAVVTSVDDPKDDGNDALGAELAGASVTYRPEREDLLVVLAVTSLPAVNVDRCVTPTTGVTVCRQVHGGAGAPGVLYLMGFELDGARFEVRAVRAAATAAPPEAPFFALYECDAVCTETSRLSGGIGTTGAEVSISVPLEAIGAEEGAALGDVQASAALGEATPGALQVLDQVDLPDASIPVPQVALGIAPPSAPSSSVPFSVQADLVDGRLSGTLDPSSHPAGPYRVWARACLAERCGVDAVPVTL